MTNRRTLPVGIVLCVLALAACNTWAQSEFDSGRSADNPFETAIGPATVASLQRHVIPKMRDGNYARRVLTMGDLLLLEPVNGRVRAFSTATCPRADDTACPQLWEYSGQLFSAGSGHIYVGHGSPILFFEAIDTAAVRVHRYDPGVSSGHGIWEVVRAGEHLIARMYLPTTPLTEALFVFPRTCGQLTCTPIATLPLASDDDSPRARTSWSATDSVVYSPDASGRLSARDLLTGATIWTAASPDVQPTEYRVKDGSVYASNGRVYDGAGRQGCSGTPTVCAPIRTLAGYRPTTWFGANASISGTRVIAGYSSHGAATAEALGFWSTDRSHCSGAPLVCTVNARTADPVTGAVSTNSLALGVGVDPDDGHSHLQAYDLADTTGCTGTPLVCAPIADFDLGIAAPFTHGYLAVAGGHVYVPTTDGAIRVFSLPGDVD